ncbi:MAG: exosome complex RNA-binding protein Csl4 [Methanobacteriaceae archaeon]|nr:exosome complex RNA-binding protein Csl4 [Tissierellales bacterium]
MKTKSGDFVLPGDLLGVSEEFVPSEWTYEEEGKIKALVTGIVSVDDKNKKISVVPKTDTPSTLAPGMNVLGEIAEVRGQRALVRIQKLKDKDRDLQIKFTGGIHISQAQKGYVAKLKDVFRIGDIVEAQVTKVMGLDNIDLKTSQKDLGVLKAMCTKCRNFMEKTGKNEVYCPRCENKETRKLSVNYEG